MTVSQPPVAISSDNTVFELDLTPSVGCYSAGR